MSSNVCVYNVGLGNCALAILEEDDIVDIAFIDCGGEKDVINPNDITMDLQNKVMDIKKMVRYKFIFISHAHDDHILFIEDVFGSLSLDDNKPPIIIMGADNSTSLENWSRYGYDDCIFVTDIASIFKQPPHKDDYFAQRIVLQDHINLINTSEDYIAAIKSGELMLVLNEITGIDQSKYCNAVVAQQLLDIVFQNYVNKISIRNSGFGQKTNMVHAHNLLVNIRISEVVNLYVDDNNCLIDLSDNNNCPINLKKCQLLADEEGNPILAERGYCVLARPDNQPVSTSNNNHILVLLLDPYRYFLAYSDNSLIFTNKNFLFMGDAPGHNATACIIRDITNGENIYWYIAAHHGSDNNDEFKWFHEGIPAEQKKYIKAVIISTNGTSRRHNYNGIPSAEGIFSIVCNNYIDSNLNIMPTHHLETVINLVQYGSLPFPFYDVCIPYSIVACKKQNNTPKKSQCGFFLYPKCNKVLEFMGLLILSTETLPALSKLLFQYGSPIDYGLCVDSLLDNLVLDNFPSIDWITRNGIDGLDQLFT